MMRALVAGGAGFIGSHLVDRLLAHGDEVVVVDNFVTGRYVNLVHVESHPRIEIVFHDLIQPLPDSLAEGPFDRIYNLASPASPRGYARYPIETQLVNSVGALHLLQLAEQLDARFLQASTSEVYGDPLVHPQREDYWGNVNPNGPRACYDEGKRFAESLVMEFHRRRGVDVRIVRIFNTYGPRSKPNDGRVVPNFCMQALRNEPITIYGSGEQTRSFCYVDDLVSGFLLLMEADGLAGSVVNLGNPAEMTVNELARLVISLANSHSEITYEPLPVDDPTRRRPDISRARELLGWEPIVSVAIGMQKTLAAFAESEPGANETLLAANGGHPPTRAEPPR